MALTFYYDFSDNDFSESIPYEADYDEAKDYIVRTHSADEILNDYVNNLYYTESEKNIEKLYSYDNFDGTDESISNMSDDVKKDLVDEVVFDLIYDTDVYEDELKDYFEQEAYDSYEEYLDNLEDERFR